jgi:hypothetical protein
VTDPYNGSWSIDLEQSRVWDQANQAWVSPDPIGREDLTFFIDGDIHDYTNTVGLNPTHHLAYTARWNGDWVPYMVRKIEGKPLPTGEGEHPEMDLNIPTLAPNRPLAYVKLIKVSESFHYRISRSPDGKLPQYVMSRQLSPGGDSFTSHLMGQSGDVTIVRVFDRVGE